MGSIKNRNWLLSCLASLGLALSTAAETATPGYEVRPLPHPGGSLTATLSDGRIVGFDGWKLIVTGVRTRPYRSNEAPPAELLAELPQFGFPSFLEVNEAAGVIVVGENSNGDIWQFDLASGELEWVANLGFNFDAAFESDERLIVSASPCFGCDNRIWRLDLETKLSVLLAEVPGASGPVAVSAAGDLLYGTSSALFPAPAGSSAVVSWSAALLASGTLPLGLGDAQVVASGFDGATSLEFDSVLGELYLAENNFGLVVSQIRRVETGPADSEIVVQGQPGRNISNLEFIEGDGEAWFRAFQPARGGCLRYTTTNFFDSVGRFEVRPRRPVASVGGPGTQGVGPFDLRVTGGPPNQAAFVYFGPSSLYDPEERRVFPPNAIAPLFTGMDLATLMLDETGVLVFDSEGVGVRTYTNHSGVVGDLAIQVVPFSGPDLLGTSTTTFP